MSRLATKYTNILSNEQIQALSSKNIHTILDFITADLKQLKVYLNLSYQDVINIKKKLINENSGIRRNGLDYYKYCLNNSAIISTGIGNFDTIIGGGLRTGNIYEICGLANSGKTQICMTIAKNITKSTVKSVLYFDTKGDFSSKRIKSMFTDEEPMGEVMEKILVSKITSLPQLISALYSLVNCIVERSICTVIIDSLPALIYSYRNVALKYSHLCQFINVIRMLANQYNIVILISNLLTLWTAGFKNAGYIEFVGSGKLWLSVPNIRIKIEKRLVDHKLEVLKSTYTESSLTSYIKITKYGVENV